MEIVTAKLPQTTPKLGSFDVIQLINQGNQVLALPGVIESEGKNFCSADDAARLAKVMNEVINNPLTGPGANGSVSVSDGFLPPSFVAMKSTPPLMFNISGTFTVNQKTYSVGEQAGLLLDRQTNPAFGIDRVPYANPNAPILAVEVIDAENLARFYWR